MPQKPPVVVDLRTSSGGKKPGDELMGDEVIANTSRVLLPPVGTRFTFSHGPLTNLQFEPLLASVSSRLGAPDFIEEVHDYSYDTRGGNIIQLREARSGGVVSFYPLARDHLLSQEPPRHFVGSPSSMLDVRRMLEEGGYDIKEYTLGAAQGYVRGQHKLRMISTYEPATQVRVSDWVLETEQTGFAQANWLHYDSTSSSPHEVNNFINRIMGMAPWLMRPHQLPAPLEYEVADLRQKKQSEALKQLLARV